jgi:hypothetical protein
MVKCGVLFEARTEFLNITRINFDFKRLGAAGGTQTVVEK